MNRRRPLRGDSGPKLGAGPNCGSESGRGRGRERGQSRERGQLVIVSALVIATVLVGLALVLNSGIYAENLSTRETADTSDASTAIEVTFSEVSTSMDVVNSAGYEEFDDARDAFEATFDDWTASKARDRARRGTAFDATLEDETSGQLLKQSVVRDYTSSDSEPEWTLATDVERVAGFRMQVERDELLDATGGTLDEDAFYVDLTDGTTEWRIYAVGDGNDVVVFGDDSDELGSVDDLGDLDDDQKCRTTGASAEIDVSAGTVGGTSCPALAFVDELSGAIEIRYANGDHGNGTYQLVVDEDASVESENFDDPSDSPYEAAAVFEAEVTVHYERSDLRHQRTRTVAAGGLAYDADD